MLPLDSNTLDNLSKKLEQLKILLIDEASLIGAKMLYNIDRRLCQIKHMPMKPFGNIDIIFCSDLYQAQPVCDSWIFEQLTVNNDNISYTFWVDNVLCFELLTVVRQTNTQFISILNRVRSTQQTDEDFFHLNITCLKTPPTNPRLPYLFQTNSAVEQHNKRMLDYLPTKLHVFEAIDKKDTPIDNISYQVDKSSLPNMIYLKEGSLVELIVRNLDTQDGLVNGVDGIFQLHTFNEQDLLWIHFTDPAIGRLREKNGKYLHRLYLAILDTYNENS